MVKYGKWDSGNPRDWLKSPIDLGVVLAVLSALSFGFYKIGNGYKTADITSQLGVALLSGVFILVAWGIAVWLYTEAFGSLGARTAKKNLGVGMMVAAIVFYLIWTYSANYFAGIWRFVVNIIFPGAI